MAPVTRSKAKDLAREIMADEEGHGSDTAAIGVAGSSLANRPTMVEPIGFGGYVTKADLDDLAPNKHGSKR